MDSPGSLTLLSADFSHYFYIIPCSHDLSYSFGVAMEEVDANGKIEEEDTSIDSLLFPEDPMWNDESWTPFFAWQGWDGRPGVSTLSDAQLQGESEGPMT